MVVVDNTESLAGPRVIWNTHVALGCAILHSSMGVRSFASFEL